MPIFQVDSDPKPEDTKIVSDGLTAFNREAGGDNGWQRLAVFLRDDGGGIIGGLLGDTYFGWLAVNIVWIVEPYRKQGYGRQLLKAAEDEARRRGCKHAHLDTMDFQALPFYQKLGYEIFGVLEDMPVGNNRYYLKKALDGSQAG